MDTNKVAVGPELHRDWDLRTRWWVFTNFDLGFNWGKLVDEGVLTYVAYGNEVCPTTRKAHQQGWVRFKHPKQSFKNVSKLFGGAHVEKMRGCVQENDDYCSKEARLLTLGKKPRPGFRTDLQGILEEVKDGMSEQEIAERWSVQWCQYRRAFERYRDLCIKHRTWKTEVRVWYGAPGTGKTDAAKLWLTDTEETDPKIIEDYDNCTYQGDFMHGYGEHTSKVLWDDFDEATMPKWLFLQATDRNKMNMNIKGGSIKWVPKKIAITSNIDPRMWYGLGTGDGWKAVAGRCAVITKTFKDPAYLSDRVEHDWSEIEKNPHRGTFGVILSPQVAQAKASANAGCGERADNLISSGLRPD